MKRALIACLFVVGCNNNSGTGSAGSLTGTWELVGGPPGGAAAGTLVLTPSRLTINISGNVFDLQTGSAPTFSWTDHRGATPITATHGGGSLDPGILAIGIGGDWTFSGPSGGSCNASLQATSIVGSCAGVGDGPLFDLNHHAR